MPNAKIFGSLVSEIVHETSVRAGAIQTHLATRKARDTDSAR